jgi:predicted phosphatase
VLKMSLRLKMSLNLLTHLYNKKKILDSSTLNDMFTHFEQLRYLDFYTLIKLSVILPHGVVNRKHVSYRYNR